MSALSKLEPLTAAQFRAFIEHRSEEERWELIDGVAIMMAPPTIGHQRIARNIGRPLINVLDVVRPAWCAEHQVGIEVAQFATFRAEPDVVVVDTDIDTRAYHADRFYCVVEILSKSDMPAIATKTTFYKSHAWCRTVVLVRQDELKVTVFERQPDETWAEALLVRLEDELAVADLGAICSLATVYKGTHLAPGRSS